MFAMLPYQPCEWRVAGGAVEATAEVPPMLRSRQLDSNGYGHILPGMARTTVKEQWLNSGTTLRMSAVAWAEFVCAPLDSGDLLLAARIIGEPVPFAAGEAVTAGQLFNQSGRHRGSLVDCMIAAVAIAENASLATSNRDDFRRFRGLPLA